MPIVEKMVQFQLRWFGYVWIRPVKILVRRINHMEGSPIVRGMERPKKL